MKILVLAPHADDESIGAGASVSMWARNGDEVLIVAFSLGTSLKTEFFAAVERLGATGILLEFPTRNFPEHRQAILDRLVALQAEYVPDLVVCPASDDTHQDHEVMRAEAERAFSKNTKLIGFVYAWNNCANQTYFINIDRRALVDKLRAIECYKSQKHRPYMDRQLTANIARLRGIMSGQDCAEAFEIIRWR